MNAPTRRIIPTLVAFAALAVGGALVAQDVTGDWVYVVKGTEGFALTIKAAGAGRVTGQMEADGTALPLTGTVEGGRVSFVLTAKDGSHASGEAFVQGDQLAVTLRSEGESDARFVLSRRGGGWSDATPLARRWSARLAGRSMSYTDRTGGGSSGGATTTHVFTFCPDGSGLAERNAVVSVYVPGAGGSETARKSLRYRWRTLTRGQEVAVEVAGEDGSKTQIGVSAGEGDIVRLGEKPMRLGDAGRRCP